MDLPIRIRTGELTEPVVSVDGLTGAPGLHLSHWPGNRTPAGLRHDLSTGCALLFAGLGPQERARAIGEASALVNNHYDTDGVLALFAVRHPERARPHAAALLRAAAAGDFFRLPDEQALAVDAIVTRVADATRSPLGSELNELGDEERWERSTAFLLDVLPEILAGDLAPYEDLWEPVVAAARCDVSDLAGAARTDDPGLDLTVWTAPRHARSSRPEASAAFDPGRHALFGTSDADRALVIGPGSEGITVRLVVSTLSWFDLESEVRSPRPDLERLALRLNELEGATPDEEHAWRAQPTRNASPELWFGRTGLESFAEHNHLLAPSSLAIETVRNELMRSLTT